MNWLSGISPGWHDIVRPLVEYAESHGIRIDQVKEKFGGLRFYTTGSDDTLQKMIDKAEEECNRTCEVCGAPGKKNHGGYVRTLCKEHMKG